jgi:hypothetical protein
MRPKMYRPETLARMANEKGFSNLEELSEFFGHNKCYFSDAIRSKRTLPSKYYNRLYSLPSYKSTAKKNTLKRFGPAKTKEKKCHLEEVRFSFFRRILWRFFFEGKIKDFNLIYKVTK